MASPLAGPPGPPDGPTGATNIPAGPPGSPGLVEGQPGGNDPAKGMAQAVTTMGAEVDRVLMAMAEAMPTSGPELEQARKLIEQAIAKFLAQTLQAPAASPTAVGGQFPGGGFSSGRP